MLVLALLAGWGLGWYIRDRWEPEAQLPSAPARPMPSSAAGVPERADDIRASGPESRDDIERLLERKEFVRALESYEALQAQADESTIQRVRNQLLAHARQLSERADPPSAIQLLQLYLQISYRDAEARMLLADAYRSNKDLRLAIEQLYGARGEAYRSETLNQLTWRIRGVVTEYASALRQRGDNNGLLELYQDLTQLEPSYAPYFLGLASAQLALGDYDAAQQSLVLVVQDPEVGVQAQQLLERVRAAAKQTQPSENSAPATEVPGIALLRSGSHFLVDVRLGGTQQARLLIDTGASLTMLTPDALKGRSAGAHATGRTGTFNTANGRVRAPIYRLDVLSVGNWQVTDLEVGVLDLGDTRIDGLLGMNFLRHFQFFIDQNETVLRLSLPEESR